MFRKKGKKENVPIIDEVVNPISPPPQLPPEIITHILWFATYRTLKEARLVCKTWYMASLHPRILKREKVTLYESDGEQIFIRSAKKDNIAKLLACERDFVNFHFEHVNGYSLSDEFWGRFGPKIEGLELEFIKQEFSLERLFYVLARTPMVRSLELEISGSHIRTNTEEDQGWPLIDQTMTPYLYHLKTLKMRGGYYYHLYNLYNRTKEVFEAIVSVSPNLSTLIFDSCIVSKKFAVSEGGNYLMFKDVTNWVVSNGDRTFELHLNLRKNNMPPASFINESDCSDLSELVSKNVTVKTLNCDSTFVLQSMRRQKNLKRLTITRITNSALQIISKNFKRLQTLESNVCQSATSSGLQKIALLSNLTTLKIALHDQVALTHLEGGLCSPKKYLPLQTLHLEKMGSNVEKIIPKLAKAYPSLKHLGIVKSAALTNKSIQFIFRYQVSLETLDISGCLNFTDAGLSGSNYSISRLKNVEKLNLSHCKQLVGSINTVSGLPNLQCLNLEYCRNISPTAFTYLLQKLPSIVELLLAYCPGVTNKHIDLIAKNMPRLRYISLCAGVDSGKSKVKRRDRCNLEIDIRLENIRRKDRFNHPLLTT